MGCGGSKHTLVMPDRITPRSPLKEDHNMTLSAVRDNVKQETNSKQNFDIRGIVKIEPFHKIEVARQPKEVSAAAKLQNNAAPNLDNIIEEPMNKQFGISMDAIREEGFSLSEEEEKASKIEEFKDGFGSKNSIILYQKLDEPLRSPEGQVVTSRINVQKKPTIMLNNVATGSQCLPKLNSRQGSNIFEKISHKSEIKSLRCLDDIEPKDLNMPHSQKSNPMINRSPPKDLRILSNNVRTIHRNQRHKTLSVGTDASQYLNPGLAATARQQRGNWNDKIIDMNGRNNQPSIVDNVKNEATTMLTSNQQNVDTFNTELRLNTSNAFSKAMSQKISRDNNRILIRTGSVGFSSDNEPDLNPACLKVPESTFKHQHVQQQSQSPSPRQSRGNELTDKKSFVENDNKFVEKDTVTKQEPIKAKNSPKSSMKKLSTIARRPSNLLAADTGHHILPIKRNSVALEYLDLRHVLEEPGHSPASPKSKTQKYIAEIDRANIDAKELKGETHFFLPKAALIYNQTSSRSMSPEIQVKQKMPESRARKSKQLSGSSMSQVSDPDAYGIDGLMKIDNSYRPSDADSEEFSAIVATPAHHARHVR